MSEVPYSGQPLSLIAPESVGGYGGVQTYMRLLVKAMDELDNFRLLASLKDSAPDIESFLSPRTAPDACVAANGNKAKFIGELLSHSHAGDRALVGHLNLSPVAYVLRSMGLLDNYGVILHGIEAWRDLNAPRVMGLRHADYLISTTPYTRRVATDRHRLADVPHHILPLAVEPNRFPDVPAPELKPSSPPIRALTVCRLSPEERYKGVGTTIEAVNGAGDESLEVKYTVVGDGRDRPRLEAKVRSLNCEDRISFLGHVSDRRLDELFRQADVFVMPSTGEGFGLVYLEAMYYGIPVIAVPRKGAQHVITHERNGLMVPPDRPDRIVDALSRLLDAEFYHELCRAAYRDARTKFSFDRFRDQLRKILDNPTPTT